MQQSKMEGNKEMGLIGENFDSGLMGGARDDEYESRSGSDNFDVASGDDQDAGDDQPPQKKKKKYHRHTPQQIHELETFFKGCPHPDEKQRSDLSKTLGLENKQVKFWFQNRRTQMKTQLERQENMILKQENEKLRAENNMMQEAISNPSCNTCGGPAILGQISLEGHQIRIENARLKDELNRTGALVSKFLGRPLSSLGSPMALSTPNFGLEIGFGKNGVGDSSNFSMSLPAGLDMGDGVFGAPPATLSGTRSPMGMMGNEAQVEGSTLTHLALAAMDELIKMAQIDSPLWIKSSNGGQEVLNQEEYAKICSPYTGSKPAGYVTEVSRETRVVMINSLALVDTFMDADRWLQMFPSMITRAVTMDAISSDTAGTGALQLMHAELQLPSPLVPVRQLNFLRFCKQHREGVWVVVDVSVDFGRNAANSNPFMNCRRLPSGCVVQDTPEGMSKITWVDHSQYDENVIHQMYRPLVNSGIGFGAHRWVATLQRQCECLAMLMSPSIPSEVSPVINQDGRRSMLRLAQRMTNSFWSGVCPSSASKWEILHIGNNNTRFMSRKHVDYSGEATSIVLSAATSVWLPVSRQRVFDFLRDGQNRGKWDIFSSGVTNQEMHHVIKGQGQGNCVSVLGASNNAANGNDRKLWLQDSWIDTSGSMIVYSSIDVQSFNIVASGQDSAYISLFPSGFSILPDGHSNNNCVGTSTNDRNGGAGNTNAGGCLLTFGIQMQNSLPTTMLTMESVDTINRHLSSTIQKIKMHTELGMNEAFFDSSES